MKDLKDYLREEIDMLTQLRAECLRNISDRDPGSLFVSHYQGNTYYYSKKYKNTHRTTHYLGTETDERVGEHILNRVNIEKATRIQSNIRLLNELLGKLCDYSNEAILDSLGSFYQTRTWNMSIAQARELELSIDGRNMRNHLSDRRENHNGHQEFSQDRRLMQDNDPGISYEVVEDDDHALFHNSDYYDLDGSFATTDNTLVRSKGETILHDLLRAFFVPFYYEPILYMDDEYGRPQKISPDFYIHCRNGKHIIIEHLGMLDSDDYLDTIRWKLKIYHLNGYDLGHNLIMTSDNMNHGMDSHTISMIIKTQILPYI